MPIVNLSLPESIATYFEISNGGDDTHLTDCFTQDARVFDEEETHQGHTAIQSWLRAALVVSLSIALRQSVWLNKATPLWLPRLLPATSLAVRFSLIKPSN